MPGMDLDAVPISDERATYLRARLVFYPHDTEAKAELIAAGREFITKERNVEGLNFRKSSYSGSGDNCVEVAKLPDGGRAIRDSKNPSGPVQFYSPAEWDAFTKGLADGEFA